MNIHSASSLRLESNGDSALATTAGNVRLRRPVIYQEQNGERRTIPGGCRREVQIDRSIRRKNIVIGTLEEFPNESAAQAAVDAIRLEINRQTPRQLVRDISFDTLVNHYRQHDLPDIFSKRKPVPDAAEDERKSYHTQVTYEGYLRKWIVPRWGSHRLTEVKAVEVERWLKTLADLSQVGAISL